MQPILQTLQSAGNNRYVYNGPSGQVIFDLSGISGSQNSAMQAQIAQAIDAFATVAVTKQGAAATIFSGLSGKTINIGDNFQNFQTAITADGATGVPSSPGSEGGYTYAPSGSTMANIWLIPTAGSNLQASTQSANFQNAIGITVHELMHAAGYDHPPASGVPGHQYPDDSDWVFFMNQIKQQFDGQQVYDPLDGNTYFIRNPGWSFNDQVIATPDGSELAQTDVNPVADGLEPNELTVSVPGTVGPSSTESFQVADSGQILSDASTFYSDGTKASEIIQEYTLSGSTLSSIQMSYGAGSTPLDSLTATDVAGIVETYNLTGQITVQASFSSISISASSGTGVTFTFDSSAHLTEAQASLPNQGLIDEFDTSNGLLAYRADYAPGGLIQTFYDTEGTNTWASLTNTYSDAGSTKISTTTVNHDGTSVKDTLNPTTGQVTQVDDYNAYGQETERDTYLSDGTIIDGFDTRTNTIAYEARYLPAGLTQIYYDTEDQYSWASITNQFQDAAAHVLESTDTVSHDGSSTLRDYDYTNTQSWSSELYYENAAGTITSFVVNWNIGGSVDVVYDPAPGYLNPTDNHCLGRNLDRHDVVRARSV